MEPVARHPPRAEACTLATLGGCSPPALQGAYENLNNNAAYPYPLCLGGLTHRHKAAIDQP